MKTKINTKYMMATTAIHQTGNIDRETADICVVCEEDADNFYGNWVYGFGFIDVKFPKTTTRELTPKEVEQYHGQITMLGDSFGPTINITGENFHKSVVLTKVLDGKVHSGTLVAPVKVGNVVALIYEDGRTFHTSVIKQINGDKITTRNSVYKLEYV